MADKIVKVCVLHDDTKINAYGRCPDCCGENHVCEVCGEHTDLNWETKSMVCEFCAECDDCGTNGVDVKRTWDAEGYSANYEKAICEECHDENERSQ
jgi:hypothetical protein